MGSNEVLSSELELLESMFSSTHASFESDFIEGDDKCCCAIVSEKPRFIFHIHLSAKCK